MHLHLRGAISFCRENTLWFDVFLLPIDRLACHAMQCTSSLRCPSACYSMTRALIQNFNQIIQYNSSKHVIVLSGSHTGILFCEKGYVGVWRGHGPLKIPVIWNRKRLFVKWKTSLETNHILWWKKRRKGNHTHKKYIVLRENSGKRNMTHLWPALSGLMNQNCIFESSDALMSWWSLMHGNNTLAFAPGLGQT